MKLVSGNQFKINEYKNIAIDFNEFIETVVVDLEEVMGTPEEVILYKTLSIPENSFVDDAIIEIDSEPVVDIKWKLENMKTTIENVTWIVHIGFHDNDDIKIFKGSIKGKMKPYNKEEMSGNFGFDMCFYPEGSNRTLYELSQIGAKNNKQFSARFQAFENMINNKPILIKNKNQIEEWKGSFQNSI